MAVRTTITNKGLQLLASSSQATGQYYWLGYYALAYVPDFWKTDTTIDFPDPDCFQVNTGTPIDPSDIDPVTPSMQRLTTYGDMIWNVWQGDLTGTGFINESDGTPGGNLFGLTMYGANVKKHYRYVLDENGNNLLVCWINDPTSTTGEMTKQTVYFGTDGFVQSELPIPAPLYYLGDVTGKFSVNDFFPDFADSEENGSDIYPFIEVDSDNAGIIAIPKVSADFRGYLDTLGNGVNAPYAPTSPGAKFDSTEIPPSVDPQFGVTGWYAGDLTYTIPESTATLNNNPAKFDTEFWKLHTSSNYNRWHAPVDNIGFILDSDLSNRNMAKTTKFFPISNYKTINTESGFTSSGESLEVATAIQLTIDLDLSPETINDGSEESQITFFDKYENADGDPAQSPKDQFGNSVYVTTHSSIKFNRIGIYAVPLRKHPCVQDQGFGSVPPTSSSCSNVSGSAVELQFQINPDDEPVLFAVMDWDNTVTLDDTGNGISSFHAEVNVNLESPDGVEDTALIRDCTIFYNLYEDDALKWYQNQLIANAQTQNAITEIGLEVQSIINQSGDDNCCPTPDLSELYASKNHTHNNLGLRNLKDAGIATDNGLRGIVTLTEGIILDGSPYRLGLQAVALGLNTATAGDNSTVAGGNENIILGNATDSFIGSGLQNQISSPNSAVVGGESNMILNLGVDSIIGAGSTNTISGAALAFIGSGNLNLITTSGAGSNTASFIGSGQGSIIDNSIGGFIGAGEANRIYLTENSGIGAGSTNYIGITTTSNGDRSFISGGFSNSIRSTDSFIGAGRFNSIFNASAFNSGIGAGLNNKITDGNGFIGAGDQNYIRIGTHSFIGGGFDNRIDEDSSLNQSNYSGILNGYENKILGSEFAVIGGGVLNEIDRDSKRSGIFSGEENSTLLAENSVIGGGQDNNISNSSNSGIFTGFNNYIQAGISSAILSGGDNSITDNGIGNVVYSTIASGYNNLIISTGATTNNNYVFIGGGNSNTITDSNFSTILGGLVNNVNADYASVIGGRNANAKNYGEITHSSGTFDGNTTVRHSMLMARKRFIASGTATDELHLDGSSERLSINATNGGYIAGSVTVSTYDDQFSADPTTFMQKLNFVGSYDSTANYIAVGWYFDTNNSVINESGVITQNMSLDDVAPLVNNIQNPQANENEIPPTGALLQAIWIDSIDNSLRLNVTRSPDYVAVSMDVSAVWDVTIYEKA